MIKCPNPDCGRPNKEDADYCVYCGNVLHKKKKASGSRTGYKAPKSWKTALLTALFILGGGTLVLALAGRGRDGKLAEESDPPVPVPAEIPSGVILVDSTPRGARIRVDGRKIGRTPCRLKDQPEGVHTVRVEYRRRGEVHYFEEAVLVKDGTPVERTYRFFPDKNSVSMAAGSSAAGWRWNEMEDRIVFTRNGCSFSLIKIPAGQFYMDMEGDGFRNVSLGPYALGETEVTQRLWAEVMGSGSAVQEEAFPMNNLSNSDCEAFVAALNRQTGEHFRLPTEAEWEYAARGGVRGSGLLVCRAREQPAGGVLGHGRVRTGTGLRESPKHTRDLRDERKRSRVVRRLARRTQGRQERGSPGPFARRQPGRQGLRLQARHPAGHLPLSCLPGSALGPGGLPARDMTSAVR
ncbi:MAG: SUMF1/EgtB/PvdO family nonheme iron enzyme [Candidatus Methanomethylophilaceae archaeon]|nr:SUMF1/EgtB/PvdO family nonheme iron enzyme [Candidatus Methanomethylophilaceae archaeon]